MENMLYSALYSIVNREWFQTQPYCMAGLREEMKQQISHTVQISLEVGKIGTW